ncbi:MAG: superoxide dismutase [Pseudomonadota bacterium]
MAFELPALPYAHDALEPYMGRETLELHHGKHHNTYVVNLNNLVDGAGLAGKDLDAVCVEGFKAGNAGIVNNAGQHWNHNLFWSTMAKDGAPPTGELAKRIENDFGSLDKLKEDFKAAAVSQFGSGWGWLVLDGDKLAVMKTPNGENPLMHGKKALMGIDVWEHAYYLDYRNRRPDYVQAWLDHLVDWTAVGARLG